MLVSACELKHLHFQMLQSWLCCTFNTSFGSCLGVGSARSSLAAVLFPRKLPPWLGPRLLESF